jgi:hypothetical protein
MVSFRASAVISVPETEKLCECEIDITHVACVVRNVLAGKRQSKWILGLNRRKEWFGMRIVYIASAGLIDTLLKKGKERISISTLDRRSDMYVY